jgi:hypothetical protein
MPCKKLVESSSSPSDNLQALLHHFFVRSGKMEDGRQEKKLKKKTDLEIVARVERKWEEIAVPGERG